MKIGVDLDDVLADFLSALIEYHNDTYRTSLTRDQFQSYRFWETWGGTKEEAIQKVYDFHKTQYSKSIKPIAGSQEAIRILKSDNDLCVITAKQDEIVDTVRAWVPKQYSDAFSDIFFANHYSQNGSSRTKKQICDSNDVVLLIEDSLDYALECLSPKRTILLLDSPWNKCSGLPQGIYRVHSWNEILDTIEQCAVNSIHKSPL